MFFRAVFTFIYLYLSGIKKKSINYLWICMIIKIRNLKVSHSFEISSKQRSNSDDANFDL
jgi:hypothetical protein